MIEKVSKMALHADKGEKNLNTKNSHLRVGGKNSYSNRDGDVELDGCVKMMRGFLVAYQLKIRQFYDTVPKKPIQF